MNIKNLSNKNTLIDDNNESYLDLSESSINYSLFNEPLVLGSFIVTDEFEMRPDLICLKYYGTTEHLGVFMEYNGIKNPFSIKSGMVLYIPDAKNQRIYKDPGIKLQEALKQESNNKIKQNIKNVDPSRLERLKSITKNSDNPAPLPLSPNKLQPGQTNFKFNNNKIELGAHLKSK
jgi:hypothetical protein